MANDKTALLLIEYQNDFTTSGGAHHGAKHGGVDQEVLTEPLVGTQTVPGQQVSDPRPGCKRFSG